MQSIRHVRGGQAPFTIIPNRLLRGGHGINLLVLAVIVSHQVCWASTVTIAEEAGLSRRSVYNAISYWKREGEAHGVFLKEERRHGGATVLTVDIWKEMPETIAPNAKTIAPNAITRARGANIRRGSEEEPMKKTGGLRIVDIPAERKRLASKLSMS